MSSILKALKKLEQEKAVRKQEEIDLSREILQDAAPAARRLPWHWGAAIVAMVLLALLVVMLLGRKQAVQMTATTEAPPRQQPAPQALPQAVQPDAAPAEVRQPTALQQPGLPVQGTTRPRKPAPKSLPAPKGAAGPEQKEPARKQPAASMEEPSLSVSGIAWNKDSSERLAIVNGQPLTTGSVIGNAIVEEIYKDKVRFSSNGKSFEIFIGKSGNTN